MKMNVSVLDTFITKFKLLWQSGHDAHLAVDTQAGQAWVRLDVRLGYIPGPHHQQVHPQHRPQPQHRDGPARRRRRQRRADARAAKAADLTNDDASVEDAAPVPSVAETAAQSVPANPSTEEAAAQAVLQLLPDHVSVPGPSSPEQSGPPPNVPAVQADSPPGWLSALLRQGDACDEFCPDQVYYNYLSGISQLDGSSLNDEWMCQCCKYAKFFPTEQILEHHHDNAHDEYKECNICYSGHVWT